MENRILIIDDDPIFVEKMKAAFKNFIFNHASARNIAFSKFKENEFALVLLDLKLSSESDKLEGLDLIAELKSINSFTPLIVVTADEKIDTVVAAMKLGADDFLRKSNYDQLAWQKKFDLHIENRELIRQLAEAQDENYSLIGDSVQFREIKNTLKTLAKDSNVTVLITGETGTGKEAAARFIHRTGTRNNNPFIAVNLSVFQDTLVESSLFGHKKGAFTGASYEREGYFLKANRGILFLDEIGDISEGIQVRLLRFLESKLISKVGDEKDIKLDIQIIAATNKDLKELTIAGKFREDLYYRLKNFEVVMPPLRDHKEDIPGLLKYYFGLNGYNNIEFLLNKQVMEQLQKYNWPGNIRELKNCVDALLIKSKILNKKSISMDCLPADLLNSGKNSSLEDQSKESFLCNLSYNEKQALVELQAIDETLTATNGRKAEAAKILNMNLDNLRYRVEKYLKKYPKLMKQFSTIAKYYKIS